ncbi:type II toxin-antitoxin system PemK/MazF family toxin [Sulfurimonas indica]|uniref:type II toxin-antitoxin system PemK/MazF family toxin n=1 Tax=Sulfurimonas TaxID=202746 RepID=UPI0012643FF8|nr:type II toxin-antitoxin system PemK/MazF family toxin [Sulfurimonas indica]
MNIKQGDIWMINFNPSIGSEIQKERPAVVINSDSIGRFGLSIVVPITEWKDFFEDFPWIIKIQNSPQNGLSKLSAIECFQIKNFSQKRFVKKIGSIDNEMLENIHTKVLKTLNPTYKIA